MLVHVFMLAYFLNGQTQSHYENMTLKITLKSPIMLKTTETTLKSFTKDNRTEISSLMTSAIVIQDS